MRSWNTVPHLFYADTLNRFFSPFEAICRRTVGLGDEGLGKRPVYRDTY